MMYTLRKLLLFPLALLILPIARLYWWTKRRKRLNTNDDKLTSIVFDATPLPGLTHTEHIKEFPFWLTQGISSIWHTHRRLPKDLILVTSPSLMGYFERHSSFETPVCYGHHVKGSYLGHPLYIDADVAYNTLNYISGSKRLGVFRVVNS